ncbi:MAG: hypothetical protein KKA84_10700 [Bacteroidetes bacterium]|nr:hypothetical protein [Bacteroidota bacterium]
MSIKPRLIIMVLGVILSSCLESPIYESGYIPDSTFPAEAIAYIDMQGSFRDNEGVPYLVEPIGVYFAPDSFIILDVRTEEQFASGHINEAINIQVPELIDYLSNLNNLEDRRILLVCADGSLSSYVHCLLRLYGFENTSVLKFGMAGWNPDFASEWAANLKTLGKYAFIELNGVAYQWDEITPLPIIPNVEGEFIPDRVKNRVRYLLSQNITAEGNIHDMTKHFCKFNEMSPYYDQSTKTLPGISIICYDEKQIYYLYSTKFAEKESHPIHSNSIELPAQTDFRLQSSIQRVPSHKTVIVYSRSHHRSAYLVAVLRLLGFNAKSLQYGVHSFSYDGLRNRRLPPEYPQLPDLEMPDLETLNDVFFRGMYGSLPYITGE